MGDSNRNCMLFCHESHELAPMTYSITNVEESMSIRNQNCISFVQIRVIRGQKEPEFHYELP